MDRQVFDVLIQGFFKKLTASKFAASGNLYNDFLKSKEKIYESYTEINNYVKKQYMGIPENNPMFLDRHKCSACIILAIMNELKIEEFALYDDFGKERAALSVGLNVLGVFIVLSAKKSGKRSDLALANFLIKNDIQLPKSICDDKNYSDNWVSEMFHIYKEQKMFVLSLSNELFLIETHNRNLAEIELLKKEIKILKKKR